MYPSARLPETFQLVPQITSIDQIIGLPIKGFFGSAMLIMQPRQKAAARYLDEWLCWSRWACSFQDNPLYVEENVLSIQMALS